MEFGEYEHAEKYFEISKENNDFANENGQKFEIRAQNIFSAEILDINENEEYFKKTYEINLNQIKSESIKKVLEIRRKLMSQVEVKAAEIKRKDPNQVKIQKYHEINFLREKISNGVENLANANGLSVDHYFNLFGIQKSDFN